MDISTLQRLHRMGILSKDQVATFALGGEYGGDEGVDPYQPWMTRSITTVPADQQNLLSTVNATPQVSFPGPEAGNQVQGLPQMGFDMSYNLFNPNAQTVAPPVATTTDNNQPSFGSDYNAYLTDEKKYAGKYRDANSIEDAYKSGNISIEERDRLQLLSPEQLKAEKRPLTDAQNIDMNAVKGVDAMRYLNPMGQDIGSSAYQFGRAASAEKGTPGKVAGMVGSGLLTALKVGKNIAAGMAYGNMNDQTRNYYDDLMKRRQYTNAPQTENTNITGGVAKYGGVFKDQSFALGGEQQPSEEEQMMMQQQAQQQQQQEGEAMPQEGQQNPQEQVMQIAQQLVAGLQSLEAIDAYLKEQKVDEQTYNAIMQIAQQILAEQEQAPTMRNGGKFKHKVGDKIEFTHKGKKHRGVIKKIENGQIYL